MAAISLELERYYFEKVVIDATEPTPGQDRSTAVEVQLGSVLEDKTKWSVKVHMRSTAPGESKRHPLYIELLCTGFFTAKSEPGSEDELEKIVAVNGASILYSAMRELLLVTSGRTPRGAIQLPLVSFAGLEFRAIPDAGSTPGGE